MGKKIQKTLGSFLRWYYANCQKNIILVHRSDVEEGWHKRCVYLDPNYHPTLKYTHRSILDNEVIFEYDEPDYKLNEKLVAKVIVNLSKDNIKYSKWFSGNKSTHLHILLKDYTVRNRSLFKNAIMRHYGTFYVDDKNFIYEEPKEGRRKITPDLKLCTDNHLIRAEFGLHEKTKDCKELKYLSPGYPCKSKLPLIVFEKYQIAQEKSVYQRVASSVSDLAESELVKKLLNSILFREGMNDGRERIMYQLIQIIKPKYKPKGDEGKEALVQLMWDWYKYSSNQGLKMTEQQVREKVNWHWNRDYTITELTLKNTIEDIGGTL